MAAPELIEAAALLGLSPVPYPFAVTSDADKQG